MRYFKVNTQSTALRIRKSASTSAEVIGSVDKGSVIFTDTTVNEDKQGDGYNWVYITVSEMSGYVAREYLIEIDAQGNVINDYTVVDNNTNNNSSEEVTNNDDATETQSSSKTILIVGGVCMAIGALMNIFM